MSVFDQNERIEIRKIVKKTVEDKVDSIVGTGAIVSMVILIIYLSFKVMFPK